MHSDTPKVQAFPVNSNHNAVQQRRSFDSFRALMGYSRSHMYNLEKNDPTFPSRIKDGESRASRVYYLESELVAWQQAQILASRPTVERQ